MEALAHFLFELVKIAIQSFIYAAFIFSCWVLLLHARNEKMSFSRSKFKRLHTIVYLILFFFSFTYYGNHGLGDSYSIPLGHWETMEAGDLYAYFSPNGKSDQIGINSYEVKGDNLCASVDSDYIIFNLNSKKMIRFNAEQRYNDYAISHDLPTTNQFAEFLKHYNTYWNGWRFWMLP